MRGCRADARIALEARDCAQVIIKCLHIAIGQRTKAGPRHGLQYRMNVVEVHAVPDRLRTHNNEPRQRSGRHQQRQKQQMPKALMLSCVTLPEK